MPNLLFILLSTISMNYPGSKNTAPYMNPLNGTWIPIRQEIGGTELSATSYVNQKLVISDSNYTFTAESIDKGVVKYNEEKMDIYGKEGVNASKHFSAIFKYGNEQLTICYNLKGDGYPDGFETKGKPLFFLSVFKKEEKAIPYLKK